MEEKLISFDKGIHRSSSLAGSNGELSECVNLIPVNGELKNIKSPAKVDDRLKLGTEDLLLAIHHVSGRDQYLYLVRRTEQYDLNVKYKDTGIWSSKSIISVDDIPSVAIMGNAVNIATNAGIIHMLWDETKKEYNCISGLDNLNIEFGLDLELKKTIYTEAINLKEQSSYKEVYFDLKKTEVFRDRAYNVPSAGGEEFADGTYIQLGGGGIYENGVCVMRPYNIPGNTKVRIKMTGAWVGMVCLFDSDHNIIARAYSTDNILSSDSQASYIGFITTNVYGTPLQGDRTLYLYEHSNTVSTSLVVENSLDNISAVLSTCNKFVKSIHDNKKFIMPFFVRAGIEMYDGSILYQTAPIFIQPNTGHVPFMAAVNNVTDGKCDVQQSAFEGKLWYRVTGSSALATLKKNSALIKGVSIAISDPIMLYNAGYEYKEGIIDIGVEPSDSTMLSENKGLGKYKEGTYAEYSKYQLVPLEFALKKESSWEPSSWVGGRIQVPEPTRTELEKAMTSIGVFHRVQDIKLGDLTANTVTYVDFSSIDVDSLGTLTNMPDEYRSRSVRYPKSVFSYNGRLNMANIKEDLFEGFCPSECNGYTDGSVPDNYVIVEVDIKTDDGSVTTTRTVKSSYKEGNKWFYYPDSRAKVARFYVRSGASGQYKYIEKTLQSHTLLDGAWCMIDNLLSEVNTGQSKDMSGYETANKGSSYSPNMIYASKTSNPFCFPADGQSQVGNGEILAISTSAKALSSGTEHGKFPLYCFCTDGVWPLSVNDEGKFGAPDAAVRDVVNNTDSICQIDGALVYATQAGLRYLQGEDAQTISTVMNGRNTDEDKFFADLAEHAGLSINDTDTIVEMLSGAKIVRDFANNLLHIYPDNAKSNSASNKWKHYVLSLDTMEWSTVVDEHSSVKAVVPGWPYYTFQTSDGNIMQFREADDDVDVYKDGVLLTRALAFDDPFAMKMLGDLRMLYTKSKSADDNSWCKIQVFVSNDRSNWTKLTSLRSKSWKWYRFRIRTHLTDLDALSGLVCMTETRRTNKLR